MTNTRINMLKPKFAEVNFDNSSIMHKYKHFKNKSVSRKNKMVTTSYDKDYFTGKYFIYIYDWGINNHL